MMYSRLRERNALLNLWWIILITAMSISSAANSETPVDRERLEYCELSSSWAATFANFFYQEGSYGVTWSDYSRLNDAWSHFSLLVDLNKFSSSDYSEMFSSPDQGEVELMYDLLVEKYGEEGAFDFLKMRVSECLSDFPTASVD